MIYHCLVTSEETKQPHSKLSKMFIPCFLSLYLSDDCSLLSGYDPEEYQEVVERHHRIDAERRKQKQDLKETKRIEEEAIVLKKKDEKSNRKLTREKRKDASGSRSKVEENGKAGDKVEDAGSGGDDSASGSGSDSDSDSDYDRYCEVQLCAA